MTILEHTRKASDEGWKMLTIAIIVTSSLTIGSLLFDMGIFWRLVWTLVLLSICGTGIYYAILNIRSEGVFVCHLTDTEFLQHIPLDSCGDSFRISLSTITQIEIYDNGGDGPSDEWYIHTVGRRYRITTNYGNPDRKFGQALQKHLPHISTITSSYMES